MKYYRLYGHESEELNAPPWQIELLNQNSELCHEGLRSGCPMCQKEDAWTAPIIYATWNSFSEALGLSKYKEVSLFCFSASRDKLACESCNGAGLTPEAQKLTDDWDDWSYSLTQDEIDALWEENRLRDFFKEKPTEAEMQKWSPEELDLDGWYSKHICLSTRAKRMGAEYYCNHCRGRGYIFTEEHAHISLTMWIVHPQIGCSRCFEVTRICQDDLPSIYKYLQEAAKLHAERFEKLAG